MSTTKILHLVESKENLPFNKKTFATTSNNFFDLKKSQNK